MWHHFRQSNSDLFHSLTLIGTDFWLTSSLTYPVQVDLGSVLGQFGGSGGELRHYSYAIWKPLWYAERFLHCAPETWWALTMLFFPFFYWRLQYAGEMKPCQEPVSKAILLACKDLFGLQGCLSYGPKRLMSNDLADWSPFNSNKSPACGGGRR